MRKTLLLSEGACYAPDFKITDAATCSQLLQTTLIDDLIIRFV